MNDNVACNLYACLKVLKVVHMIELCYDLVCDENSAYVFAGTSKRFKTSTVREVQNGVLVIVHLKG